MSLALAKDTIVRKFTNYRNKLKRDNAKFTSTHEMMKTIQVSADALVDFKSSITGKDIFKRKRHQEIVTMRDILLEEDSSLSPASSFQKAFEQLWAKANQDYWEEQASAKAVDDIYK